jgi:ABC-type oligopeptide transport system substrate-binding subunit
MTRLMRLLALALLSVLALAACGGESEAEKEREKGKSAFTATCEGSALSGDVGLPSGFPKPDGVTYLKASKAGPSSVVDGTYDGELDDAYEAYEKAVGEAGYNVLFKEKEKDDAEISYEGAGKTGQIALREACDNDMLAVHITNRPE